MAFNPTREDYDNMGYNEHMIPMDEGLKNRISNAIEGIANDTQVGGNHDKEFAIQPWDIIDCYNLNFYEGNVIKYLLREKDNRLEDLKKAQFYLNRHIKDLENESK